MIDKVHIRHRVNALKLRAALRYNISPEKCHVGHLALQSMLERPKALNQIDAATDTSETNESVANRSMRLANALANLGLQPGDAVVVMGPNHLDIAIPYYACHFNGYSMCGMDPNIGPADLKSLLPYITPKVMFCQKREFDHVKECFSSLNMNARIIVFDDEEHNMANFVKEYNGTEVNFKPAEFDHSKIPGWLMLTSGTTGLPKVAVITFEAILNGVCCWWEPFTDPLPICLTMTTFQWLSSLMYFISGPLRLFTRLQSSVPLTPQILVMAINKYKPSCTAWTPYLLGKFLQGTEKICDLTCFRYIAIGGNSIEKPLLDKFKERTNAFLYLVYSMTELLVPGFKYGEETPFGSVGKPFEQYQYRLVDDDGSTIDKPFKRGELWMKGDDFFKGYLKNPEETRQMLTEDGWLKTGDLFQKDEEDNYYFVERKRLLIKSSITPPGQTGPVLQSSIFWISPLQMEDVIKKHPAVAEACVVGIPDKDKMQVPVAAIIRKNGHQIQPKEIFDLVKEFMPELRQLHGGFFYLDQFPITPSGKVHRSNIREIALTAQRILPTKS